MDSEPDSEDELLVIVSEVASDSSSENLSHLPLCISGTVITPQMLNFPNFVQEIRRQAGGRSGVTHAEPSMLIIEQTPSDCPLDFVEL